MRGLIADKCFSETDPSIKKEPERGDYWVNPIEGTWKIWTTEGWALIMKRKYLEEIE